ncbi:hypothetical protein [Sphingobacterium haloxyli]|uniref:Uncharacterized protein n=1 Tax=Sphingobacterium haloxyli TaxID=2100533 RepID=A0A2S9J0U2_9SPHI|nr:hypothetical protein [Sphingobacterium haloxyli]PRD46397.1 hypothetical protein C5745_15595 [Sphingobacterium haloxyli]
MATKVENEKTGLREKKKKKEGDTYQELGSVIEKTERTKDGDGEAGVDSQAEQLNDMPNDPTDRPLEREKKDRKAQNKK